MEDPFIPCPYNDAHRIRRSRIHAHIVKCQEKYPKLKICPYNATHRLPEHEMRSHVVLCPSKSAMLPNEHPEATGAITTPKPIYRKDYMPETDPNHEIWND